MVTRFKAFLPESQLFKYLLRPYLVQYTTLDTRNAVTSKI